MITLNKEILMHPDFAKNLADELCEYLEALMDAEFEKGDECDFDFIDECADAINEIRSGGSDILPVISRKDFFKRINGRANGKYKAVLAACAAIALILGVASFSRTENTSFIKEISGYISELFGSEKPTEHHTFAPETTTQPPAVTEEAVTGIEVETTPEFKTEYAVGESFSAEGIKVYALYENGARKSVKAVDFTVEVPESFASQAKYETVTVKACGFEKTLEVRVIDTLETKKLTSLYALFADGFDFTAEDLENIDLSAMKVYAVYSDESERELSSDEYYLEFEDDSTFFEKRVIVTVGYESCSCSFAVTERR